MRVFETGATRDVDVSKLDFDGFLSPLAIVRFAEYMNENRQTAAGLRDSDNWQKGIPLDAYRKSSFRHFVEFWTLSRSGQETGDEIERALCAMIFNVQGYLHEALKQRAKGS